MRNIPKLAIIVPCYNEDQVLGETIKRLSETLENLIDKKKIKSDSFVLYVDDGSEDDTWSIIKSSSATNLSTKGIKLSRNRGHQNALLAGMEYVEKKCDCLISIDADLQDDISIIGDMIDKYLEGNEIVYGVRNNRDTDNFFKKNTAEYFYKFMKIFGVELVYNHADYRLMGSHANSCFLKFKENNLFIRGIIPSVGFKADKVYYKRLERFAGESKYPLKKMLAFAWDGITSFSVVPLRFITFIGFVIFLGSLVMGGGVVYSVIAGKTIHGWASTVLPIYFMGGIQLMCLGVIGEYIGNIYKETKRRPRYFIEEIIDAKS